MAAGAVVRAVAAGVVPAPAVGAVRAVEDPVAVAVRGADVRTVAVSAPDLLPATAATD
jgi:hypothetical protein